jgi:hypothetical protein
MPPIVLSPIVLSPIVLDGIGGRRAFHARECAGDRLAGRADAAAMHLARSK